MIAFADSTPSIELTEVQERFLELLPRIVKQASFAFRSLRREARQEMIQEVVANAYCAFAALARQGKSELAYATPLAQYAIRQACGGRRVGARLNVRDATSEYAKRAKGIVVESLDRFDRGLGEWEEILVEDRRGGPAEIAAARVDVAAWLSKLSKRTRRIAIDLGVGHSTCQTAAKYRLSPTRISQIRRELHQSWLTFHGSKFAEAA